MAAGSRLAELEVGAPRLSFRRAVFPDDFDWLLETEHRYENAGLIGQQTLEEHEEQTKDPDAIYWIVETEAGERCAYCLIRGLRDTLGVVYLQRICVDLGAYRGAGVGMALLLRIIHFAFDTLGAHKVSPHHHCSPAGPGLSCHSSLTEA